MRERLAKLLQDNSYLDVLNEEHWLSAAEQLIQNGVILPPCDNGATRYVDAEKVKEHIKDYGKGAIEDGYKTLDPVDDILAIANIVDYMPAVYFTQKKITNKPRGICPSFLADIPLKSM